jgi:hypothetical protein
MGSVKPTRKVSAGVVGTGLTALVFWLVDLHWQVRPPPGVEAMCAMLFGFAASWTIPDRYEQPE